MSLAGRAAFHGSTVTIYRSVEAETGDGGRKAASWTLLATGVRCLIESAGDEIMQKVFGSPVAVKDRVTIPGLQDLLPYDAMIVTAGKRMGSQWRVEPGVRVFDQSAWSPHVEAPLTVTTEIIP